MIIYKVCPKSDYLAAKESGFYAGMPIDHQDGFLHFSTAHQLAETLEKHFKGQQNLVLLYVDAERVENDLRWEPSRGGDLFPHLYADLALKFVVKSHTLVVDNQGNFELPEDVR